MHYFTFVMLNGSEASSPPCKRRLVALRRSFTIVQDDKGNNEILPLQQNSFGRNQAKRWWPGAWQGIAMFCIQGIKATGSPGQKYCSPGFA
jgi:hypothetical protein